MTVGPAARTTNRAARLVGVPVGTSQRGQRGKEGSLPTQGAAASPPVREPAARNASVAAELLIIEGHRNKHCEKLSETVVVVVVVVAAAVVVVVVVVVVAVVAVVAVAVAAAAAVSVIVIVTAVDYGEEESTS